MRAAPILIVVASSLILVNCARSPEAITQKRIAGVEQGLLSDYSDPPWIKMENFRADAALPCTWRHHCGYQ